MKIVRTFFLLVLLFQAGDRLEAENRLEAGGWSLEDKTSTAEHQVTVSEYCEFLNVTAVYDLYDEKIDGIVRLGIPGSYHYEVIEGKENQAMTFISSLDAARYGDWQGDGEALAFEETLSLLNIDPLLKANRVTFHVTDALARNGLSQKNSLEEDLKSPFYRFCVGGVLTVGSLFSERFRASEVEGRGTGEMRQREVVRSGESTNEMPPDSNNPKAMIAFHEKQVRDLEAKTALGQLREGGWHTMRGLGHMTALGLEATFPWVDEGRLATLGAMGGYGGAALFAYLRGESPFEMMNEGAIGAVTGATAVSGVRKYFFYKNWETYSARLAVRRQKIKEAFSKAKSSFSAIGSLESRLTEARNVQTEYYKELHNNNDQKIILDYATEQKEKAQQEYNTLKATENAYLSDATSEALTGLKHAAFASLNIAVRSYAGVCAGSFIGVVIPLSYTLGDFYTPWVVEAMNTSAGVYGVHFLGSDLANGRNAIRGRTDQAAAAFTRAAEAWNRPAQVKALQEKLQKAQDNLNALSADS